MPSVVFVTYSGLPGGSGDDMFALHHLRQQGITTSTAAWDAPDIDWASFDRIVLRSCWDYHKRPDEFRAWLDMLEATGARLWNPVSLVRWNMEKTYLRDLSREGAVVPAIVWVNGGKQSLTSIMWEEGWQKAVVKPIISASAHETWLATIEDSDAQQDRFSALLQGTPIMVQEFMPSVVRKGEWSFVFIGREFSHAVLKQPSKGDFRVQEEYGGSLSEARPSPTLVEQAISIVGLVPGPWLYARVDAVDVRGRLVLMELELIEPYLFLERGDAAHRFADAIVLSIAGASNKGN